MFNINYYFKVIVWLLILEDLSKEVNFRKDGRNWISFIHKRPRKDILSIKYILAPKQNIWKGAAMKCGESSLKYLQKNIFQSNKRSFLKKFFIDLKSFNYFSKTKTFFSIFLKAIKTKIFENFFFFQYHDQVTVLENSVE